MWLGIFIATVIVTYAITTLFFTSSERSNFSKKAVFQFNLTTGMEEAEIGPGDSFKTNPVIYNDATEEMYVFIHVDMPTIDDEPLYSIDADREWCIVSEHSGTIVYA